jgi:hypothetical protein
MKIGAAVDEGSGTQWQARLRNLAETLRPDLAISAGAAMKAACVNAASGASESWMGRARGRAMAHPTNA